MRDASAVTTPGTEQHKLAQRERILAAAQACFIRSGFHSASMATIAETAGMSPGLIYRYFENKNAIILAIIDKQLELAQHRIRDLSSTDDLCAGLVEYFNAHDADSSGNADAQRDGSMSTALFLEIAAEATRDPEIARAVSRFDQAVRDEFVDWLRRSAEQGGYKLGESVIRERALLLVLVIEGLKVRKIREPDLDREVLRDALAILNSVLAMPEHCDASTA